MNDASKAVSGFLHSYITLTDIKLCFLIMFDLQQFIIVRLKGLLGIMGFFFLLPVTGL